MHIHGLFYCLLSPAIHRTYVTSQLLTSLNVCNADARSVRRLHTRDTPKLALRDLQNEPYRESD